MRLAVLVASALLSLASATPYQQGGGFLTRGGYHDTQIAPGLYSVRVAVNAQTSRGTAMTYAYRRAGELCPSGYDVRDSTQGGDVVITRTRYATTASERPEVTLIVQCRVAHAASPSP